MSISPKNAEIAARMVGLDQTGPIRADDRDALIAQAGRLARFMDSYDRVDSDIAALGASLRSAFSTINLEPFQQFKNELPKVVEQIARSPAYLQQVEQLRQAAVQLRVPKLPI